MTLSSNLLMQLPSSDTTILILCAGEQQRWQQDDNPLTMAKQLVNIAGQPLLYRTIQQVREYGAEPIVVTHRSDLQQYGQFAIPSNRKWTCETALSMRHLWTSRTIVLLGDVIYSPYAMYHILTCNEPLTVFGRNELRFRPTGKHYELFGLSFSGMLHNTVASAMDKACKLAYEKPPRWAGQLRVFYEVAANLPLGKYAIDRVYFYPIEDWTEDIDCLQDYLEFKRVAVGLGWCQPIFNGR